MKLKYLNINLRNFFSKKIVALVMATAFTIVPVGCSSNSSSNDNNVTTEQTQTNSDNNQKASTEQDVLDYLSDRSDQLNEYLQSDTVADFNYEINQTLAEMAGFMFYDDPILGYSLKDLTDSGKREAAEIWQKTVNVMEEKYPKFTGKVEEGFNSAKNQGIELFNTGGDALDGALESVIGEEEYSNLKERASDTKEKGQQKIHDWYQKYNGEN